MSKVIEKAKNVDVSFEKNSITFTRMEDTCPSCSVRRISYSNCERLPDDGDILECICGQDLIAIKI